MTPPPKSPDTEENLVERILATRRPVVFLLGSALTAPESEGTPGVPTVETIARRIHQQLGDKSSDALRNAFDQKNYGEVYRLGFENLIERGEQDDADAVIRRAVLDAYTHLSADECRHAMDWRDSHRSACDLLMKNTDGWYLRPSVAALGEVLAAAPDRFPHVLTTNFDPLVEIAIKRAGGAARRSVLARDGNPIAHAGDGTHVVYAHGYWYGADTLHTQLQLGRDRPGLQTALEDWIRESFVVVLGYGGWDDVLMRAMARVAANGNARPEIAWGFYKTAADHVVRKLEPAGTRARFYDDVDIHRFLPRLRDAMGHGGGTSGFGPDEQRQRATWLEPPYTPAKTTEAGFRLLQSRYGIVPMSGRDALLKDFDTWCDGAGLAVRLVTAPGGHGKSRLLRELCKRRDALGWTAGLIRHPTKLEGIIERARAEVRAGRACLFAVDYAETWGDGLAELLLALHQEAGDQAPVRVVLAARTKADWWNALTAKASNVEALDVNNKPVVPLSAPDADPKTIWNDARRAFAHARGLDTLPHDAPPDALLARLHQEGILTVHAAALLATTGEPIALDISAATLFDKLLVREATLFWKPKADEFVGRIANRDELLRKVAAVATLVGPLYEAQNTRNVLQGTPGLADLGEHELDATARVFASLYPSPNGQGDRVTLPPIQPDRIGERLVASVFAADPSVAQFALNDSDSTARALRVLGRTADWHLDTVRPKLIDLARKRPLPIARAWVAVAAEEAWASGLAQALEDALGPLDNLPALEAETLCDSIPLESVALRGIAVTLARRALAGMPALQQGEEDTPETRGRRAELLGDLGNRLALLGKHDEALVATQDAVDLYRRLAKDHPDVFEPDLAVSLNNLGNMLSELARHDEALIAAQDAVDLDRRLAKDHPYVFEPKLAGSLNNLGERLSGLARHDEALVATHDAVDLYRRLAKDRPDVFEPKLAMSLNNLGVRLSDLARHDEALVATHDAVDLYRRLAKDRPDFCEPDLAVSLNNLGVRLSDLARHDEALVATQDAVDIRRRLTKDRPYVFEPDLASSLNSLGNRLYGLARHDEALVATQDAVDLYRRLAKDRPYVFEPNLAASLNNLGVRLYGLARHDEALVATHDAVDLYRRLAKDRPYVFEPDLASGLNNLGVRLSKLARHDEALTVTQDAVDIRRRLAKDHPDIFEPDLAGSLNNLGVKLSKLARHDEAFVATQDAVDLYRRLAKDRPDVFEPDLAMSLRNLSIDLTSVGKDDEAVEARREAADVQRRCDQRRRH